MTNKIITYDNTEGDRTIPDLDLIYNKPIEIVKEIYKMFVNYYIDYNNKSYLIDNKINRPKIRMLFNDGGQIVLLCNEHLIYVNSEFEFCLLYTSRCV